MKIIETISYISIAVIAISLFFIGTQLTGHATTGVVNVTIDTSIVLNFSTSLLDFSNGTVTTSPAKIYSNGTTVGGTWDPVNGQLVLENVGNVDVSIDLNMNKTAAVFIGGTSPDVQAHVTDNETNSCDDEGSQTFANYASITNSGQTACGNLSYQPGSNSINIDFGLIIPNDASGARTVGIIATGSAA